MSTISNPRLDTLQAAHFLGFAPATLKVARVTGKLAGIEPPQFRKCGRKVLYDLTVLEDWISQFENKPNTGACSTTHN